MTAETASGTVSGPQPGGDLTPLLSSSSVWFDEWVDAAALPIIDVPFVSVGGGMGSLAMVDALRISEVPAASIAVLGRTKRPHETYRTLARRSQIPDHERLRSDSGSVMDNLWGWPSYALREAAAASRLRDRVRPLWNVLSEPIVDDYYTPQAGQVYASVERECDRIGWDSMLRLGRVKTIRRRAGGGYFVTHTPPEGTASTRRVVYRCRHVHVAVGYPAIRMLPDLQKFRQETGDLTSVVNAYESHDHVYRDLIERPSTVVVRGSGIVSSRVLQRILDDVEAGLADTRIVHLFRTYADNGSGRPARGGRPTENGFALQGFNYPKASWGGQLREQLLALEGDERRAMLDRIGGTTTAPRKSWRRQLERAAASGHYTQVVGEVDTVKPGADGGTRTLVRTDGDARLQIDARFVIDATGLVADVRANEVLAELLDHCGAGLNPLGRLAVSPTFELDGTRSEDGRMHASGSITLGGPYAPVDSFLGLQYCALTIAEELASLGFCRRLTPGRSLRQWWRWSRGLAP